jgi:peptidoglycan L-alanyl-D-glutamate endopeptidase CwlK
MPSSSLSECHDSVFDKALRMLTLAHAESHFELMIYCTRRTPEEQARLFRRGRSLAAIKIKSTELLEKWKRPDLAQLLIDVGPQNETQIVTWAGPGQSLHNYGHAIDCVPLRDGKLVWSRKTKEDQELWLLYGQLAEEVGFEWGGRWQQGDYPHAQTAGLDWRKLISQGAYFEDSGSCQK